MEYIKLLKNNRQINIINANNFLLRLKGLMGKELKEKEGLILTPCNQIHTFFMKGPIDVIYLTLDNKVIQITENMRPYRFGKIIKGAKKVLELKGGASKHLNISVNDILDFTYKI